MFPTRTYEKPIDLIVSVPIPVNGWCVIVSDFFESYPVCYGSSTFIPLKMREGYSSEPFSLSSDGTSIVVKDLTKRLSSLYVMEFGGALKSELSADNASSLSENGD